MGLNIDKDEEMVPVDEFQPKPVDPQTLIAKVKKLLASGRTPMLVTQQEQLRADVTALVDKLGPGRSSLIPILQDVKRRHHGIDTDAMQIVADLLDIHPVEVYSVATFYAFLSPAAQGEFVVRLCRTVSCELAGKDAIARQLETELGIAFGETSEDGRFTLEWANCM